MNTCGSLSVGHTIDPKVAPVGEFDLDNEFDLVAFSSTGHTLGESLGYPVDSLVFCFGDLRGGLISLSEVSLLLAEKPPSIQLSRFDLAALDFAKALKIGASAPLHSSALFSPMGTDLSY